MSRRQHHADSGGPLPAQNGRLAMDLLDRISR